MPFWLHVALMQGRALEHRIVLGVHQMSLTLFGGSDARDLFSGRILIGTCSAQKWITTYGHVKKPAWDANVKGRGTYGPLGERPELVQIAYIPQEEANVRLRELPEAPEWFDAGRCVPWITEEHICEVESSYGAGRWVPGWGHLFDDDADTDGDVEQAAHTLAALTESDQSAGVTDHVTVTLAKLTGDPSSVDDRNTLGNVTEDVTVEPWPPITLGDWRPVPGETPMTLPEACRTGVIPMIPGAARKARMTDSTFPPGIGEGRDQRYYPTWLQIWHANRPSTLRQTG
ncbi:hypothetical protein [Candidatus Frankia alpina]|uniref:Uncharacterized protein n=1 Tax=Candidatus Frankia alpina TaxID=2699483 RepID=A0A4S5ERV2_9ACTN|nr:hypothetical protein [Candidatus Frankia alpina]THJ75076.1 hypothetical protein E7Y31_07625 [Candidatus Frankia alpina]